MNDLRCINTLRGNPCLNTFIRSLARFDKLFCDCVAEGVDFTLKLEVRGDKGRLIHCRVYADRFERPSDS